MRGALLILLCATAAQAHPQGFHERVAFTISRQNVDALLVMDVDSGERSKLIRAGADFNHDGVLSPEERGALQKKLVQLATQGLRVDIAGYALEMKVTDVKLSTRDDRTVSETGLSLAVMLECAVKSAIGEGMKLEIEAVSPDQSHVLVEVTSSMGDGGMEALDRHELMPGDKWTVRLGVLGPRR